MGLTPISPVADPRICARRTDGSWVHQLHYPGDTHIPLCWWCKQILDLADLPFAAVPYVIDEQLQIGD